jgi:hypothetical protein
VRQSFLTRFAVILFLLLLATPAAAQQRAEPAPLFETPGLAVEAMNAIAGRVGHDLKVALVDIRGSDLTLHVQGARPNHIDQWVWMRRPGALYGSWTRVRGPEPAQPLVPTLDPETVFFSLEGVPLDDLPGLIETTLPRAMLEEPALPQSIRIDRQLLLVGGTRAGEPGIAVHWNTGRESSYVYLHMDGSVRSANVSGTLKARGLDMVRDDWHLPMAARDFEFFRGFPDILKVDIEPRDIDVIYMDPQNPGASTGMRWTLDGLRVNAPLMPHLRVQSHLLAVNPQAAFNFDEIDFEVLPELKKAAQEQVAEPGTRVLRMVAERHVTGTGPAELYWTLTIGDPAKQGNLFNRTEGEKWEVIATPGGEIVRLVLPPGRRPQVEWWTPAGLRDGLDRLSAAFPDAHPFHEIVLDPRGGRAHAVDASDTAVSRDFNITVQDVSLSQVGQPRNAAVDVGWFTMDALDGYTMEVLSDLIWKTFGEMNLPDGQVSRLTFSRGNLWVRPPEGQVMLEIRVERGFDSGRITWLSDGTELDRVLP